jgi:uncharacterized Zn-finger protein
MVQKVPDFDVFFFFFKRDWKRHEMMHTGERPYKCPVSSCTMGFVKKSYLTHHKLRVHPNYREETEDPTSPKVIVMNEISDFVYEEIFADNC